MTECESLAIVSSLPLHFQFIKLPGGEGVLMKVKHALMS